MSLYLFLFFVLQLATEEPAVGNRTARNRKPDSPQLKNEVLHRSERYFTSYTSGKKTV